MDQERREYRHLVSLQGRYRSGTGVARDVVVLDLSTHGCKFFDRFCNLRVGSHLSMRVGNVGPLSAMVKWVEAQHVGVEFENPLHTSVLEHMCTTISGWQPPAFQAPQPTQTKRGTEQALPPISVTIRPPERKDIRQALRELQMSLPLRTEAEFDAVFHRLLELILVDD